jgi:heme A synthase
MLFDQAVFAGQMLGGSFGALHTHHDNATYAAISVLIAAACGVLLRWPGRGPLWPALACVGLFALIGVQMMLGFARTLTLHIPLGVTIILLGAVLVVWAWRYHPAPRAGAPGSGEESEHDRAGSKTEV